MPLTATDLISAEMWSRLKSVEQAALRFDNDSMPSVSLPSSSNVPRRVERLAREVMRLNAELRSDVDPMVAKGGKIHARPTTPQQVTLGLEEYV